MHSRLRLCSLLAAIAGLTGSALAQADAAPPDSGAPQRPAPPSNLAPAPKGDPVENSVVKVFSTVRYPDYYRPWTKEAPSEISGTGVVIEGKRILSNAHVVLYASQIQVQANQAGDKISATVVAIAPDMDLAVLKLDDESFFETHHPLARAQTLPQIKDAVMAYGYPEGGASLSITKGIVSRIEFTSYNFPASGLRIQIDAAINPGNSGGPAVAGEKMIGLAFSHLGGAENIGYIIPCEEIEIFLKDIADGHYDGKPAIFDSLQTFENPALRSFLKLDKSVHGIIVHQPDSPDKSYPLKEWDVITKIGNTPVDDEGMISLGELRVSMAYLVQKVVKNGKVPLTIVRSGKEMAVELPVKSSRPMVLSGLNGAYPPYFIYGSLVFSTATTEYLGGLIRGNNGRRWLTILMTVGSPLLERVGDKQKFESEQLVVISSPFFPHKVSKGYANPLAQVVQSINGIPIKNLDHLVRVLRDCKDQFLTIEFSGRHAETLVFNRAQLLAATDEILTDNGVRSQGSPELMSIWNGH